MHKQKAILNVHLVAKVSTFCVEDCKNYMYNFDVEELAFQATVICLLIFSHDDAKM